MDLKIGQEKSSIPVFGYFTLCMVHLHSTKVSLLFEAHSHLRNEKGAYSSSKYCTLSLLRSLRVLQARPEYLNRAATLWRMAAILGVYIRKARGCQETPFFMYYPAGGAILTCKNLNEIITIQHSIKSILETTDCLLWNVKVKMG